MQNYWYFSQVCILKGGTFLIKCGSQINNLLTFFVPGPGRPSAITLPSYFLPSSGGEGRPSTGGIKALVGYWSLTQVLQDSLQCRTHSTFTTSTMKYMVSPYWPCVGNVSRVVLIFRSQVESNTVTCVVVVHYLWSFRYERRKREKKKRKDIITIYQRKVN